MPVAAKPKKAKRNNAGLKPWTPEELDALSTITPEDIANAQAWAAQNASKRLTGLLNATPDDGHGNQ